MRHFQSVKLLRAGAFCLPALLLGVGAQLPAQNSEVAGSETGMEPRVVESYGKLPLSFEANRGQTDARVKFLARGPGYGLFLTSDSAVLSLRGQRSNSALRMKLLGANRHAAVTGANELPGKSNYFVSRDPKQWRTNVPTYAAVKYTGVYPGIDLVYHGNQRLLEYDFVVAPGADPRKIDLRFHGADTLTVNSDGALVMAVGENEVVEPAPVVYQEVDGMRRTIAGSYVLRGRGRVGFRVAEYDRERTLVIDPTLVYSTSFPAGPSAIAVDTWGNAYLAGNAWFDFPTTPGAIQTVPGPHGASGFVCKLNASGSALVYCTYISGVAESAIVDVAVDSTGNAFVTGVASMDFPTTPGAFQPNYRASMPASSGGNAFVTKLNPTGSALVYSTYVGGMNFDAAFAIAVDALGNAYITGYTRSPDFPVTPGAFQTSLPEHMTSAFVTKLNAAGSALVYSTLLISAGVSNFGSDAGSIAVDTSGSAYVAGGPFPVTPGAFRTVTPGTEGFYVAKLNETGSGLIYSTYIGKTNSNLQGAIAVDGSGNAYIAGSTNSADFPITTGAFRTTFGGGDDGFVTKLNAAGTGLVYSTYLGGSANESVTGIAVDIQGNAYVTGSTRSSDFPVTVPAFQVTLSEAFVAALNTSGSALIYGTYLAETLAGSSVAVDRFGNAYVTGTALADLATTWGAFQPTYSSNHYGFVAKLSGRPGLATMATLSPAVGYYGWFTGPVTATLTTSAGTDPVSGTYYRLDTGPYETYTGPFSMSNSGVHQLWYYSTDTAGNVEVARGKRIAMDYTAPTTHVAALPATTASPNFLVRWSGTDATSGIWYYSICFSDDGGPFQQWLQQTTETQAWFVGSIGHTYAFYSIGMDNAGNWQGPKTTGDTVTYIPQMRGDANGDGRIDCADARIVRASFGKRSGQAGFDSRADINADGVVDIRDLALVSQKLIPGTTCP